MERQPIHLGNEKMLTDVFVTRYSNVLLFRDFEPKHRRLIVQGFRLLEERICPYWIEGNESATGKEFWTEIQSRMAMELGLKSLSDVAYAYTTTFSGKAHTVTGTWTMNKVCEAWMLKEFDARASSPDEFIKERLSLVELGFRKRREVIDRTLASEGDVLALLRVAQFTSKPRRIPHARNLESPSRADTLNAEFASAVDELNTRFRQAGCDLHYHNGFIQIATDPLSTAEIDQPFWSAVAHAKWKNVDVDMKEALDQRDTNGRDPAFYAARALESTIKIICAEKGWSRGKEKGAHHYIDSLAAGDRDFLAAWEVSSLKDLFTRIRNPLSHGPGQDDMPRLTPIQTDWAIETCMSWIKSLIRRT